MLAAHLRSCDLLLQPYPDGVSTRRTSLMAGLALGVPAVTTLGRLTESLWQEQRLAMLVPADDTPALVAAVEQLAAQPEVRREWAERGRAGYRRYFSLEKTLEILRGIACAGHNGVQATA